GAYSVPPKAAQVLGVNWRPPENPLPLLMLQSPVDSHCAIASHTPPREDSGADGAGLVPTRTSAGRGSVRTCSSRRSRSVSCPWTRVTEYVTSRSPGTPGSTTVRAPSGASGSSVVVSGASKDSVTVSASVAIRVTVTSVPGSTGVDGSGSTTSSGPSSTPR